MLAPVQAGLHLVSASRGGRTGAIGAITRVGILWPGGNSPGRDVAPASTPNQ
jgi:hypothetical protein